MEQQKLEATEVKPSAAFELPIMIGEIAATVPNPNKQPPQKYVSLFRIDGIPILPPLMTAEKRRQMVKIKEKAIKVEHKMQLKHRKKVQFEQQTSTDFGELPDSLAQCSVETTSSSASSGSSSTRSSNVEESKQREDDSYQMLSNILQRHKEVANFIGAINNVTPPTKAVTSAGQMNSNANASSEAKHTERSLEQRMQKLQKSETLIYDNRSNTIIVPMTKQEEQRVLSNHEPLEKVLQQKCDAIYLKDRVQKAHVNYLRVAKGESLLRRREEMPKTIPLICVNPPTPQADKRSFCDVLSATESVDSIDISDMKRPEREDKSETCCDTCSSDDSFTNPHQPKSGRRKYELNAKKKITNITAKIIQFEQMHLSDSSGGDNTPHKLPLCGNKPPMRSATSPALKPLSVRAPASALDLSKTERCEAPLVRSGSFTLECPSEALLDHMRQQKVHDAKSRGAPQNQLPLSSARRDTVESKAKRVQKVETKPRSYIVRQPAKAISHTVIPHSISPYVGNHNPITFRNKRSPYDVNSSGTKPKLARPLKKTILTATTLQRQARPRILAPSISRTAIVSSAARSCKVNTAPPSATKPPFKSPMFLEIEAEHQQKLDILVAQQQEEQRRLQQTFELQQKMLLDELSQQLGSVQVQSPSLSGETNFNLCVEGISIESTTCAPKSDFSELGCYKSPPTSLSTSAAGTPSAIGVGYCDLGSSYDERSSSCATVTGGTVNGSCTQRFTPRRRLFMHEQPLLSAGTPMVISGANGGALQSGNITATNTSAGNRRHIEGMPNAYARQSWAASKINAGARGFLVRRLFQTEQIQRIVQTIRDTLIFVLNLHLETHENPTEAHTPANIKLKARLLQQLSSASRTLHLVFFQTTIRERMEIIARDRKRIKTKLLSMNLKRSPRIVG